MRLSEMLTAIREYPALKIQYEAMREQQASQERTAVQLSISYNNLQIGNRQLSQKNKALEAALAKLVPRLKAGNTVGGSIRRLRRILIRADLCFIKALLS